MDGHDALTYYCLDLDRDFLESRVELTPYSYGLQEDEPYNCEKAGFPDYLGQRHLTESDHELFLPFFKNSPPVENAAPVWQILTVYSCEPDFGMDGGLKLSPLQKLMGSSQTWRHEEFHLGFKFGRVCERASHFNKLSELAFEKNDPYWGFRFAARAIHYLEDSGTPYHASPGTLKDLLAIPFRYRRSYVRISNYHKFHDKYLGYRLWRGYAPFVRAIKASLPLERIDLDREPVQLRKKALKLLPLVRSEISALTGKTLDENQEFTGKREYFDKLVASRDTGGLDRVSIEMLKNLAQVVKTYVSELETRYRFNH